jgi:flagellar basal body-associated protein FliL
VCARARADNTAVIVIIIICVLMLLVVLVIGAYYLVHGNTLNERPVETSVVHNPKMSAL